MREYQSKQELIQEIKTNADKFIMEFQDIKNEDKDNLIEGVDRSPAQMIAYQLGWMNLILGWEADELAGKPVITPKEGYKWNAMGGLYQSFYDQYAHADIPILIEQFQAGVQKITELVDSYTEDEVFVSDKRKWASSTASKWPVYKWIHINTVAPFQSFRTKIRKWKKCNR